MDPVISPVNWRNGLRFVLQRAYEAALPAPSQHCLTNPKHPYLDSYQYQPSEICREFIMAIGNVALASKTVGEMLSDTLTEPSGR